MTEDYLLQESALNLEASPQLLLPTVSSNPNHSELPSTSQSLRGFQSDSSQSYYGPKDPDAMQSTSDFKTCKKRDSACSLRNGFIAKRHLHRKQCNGSTSRALNSASHKRVLCPDAPRNTTSFLIDDLEERKRDMSPPSPSVSPTMRARCCSTSVATPSEECPIAKLIPPKEEESERSDDYYDMVDSLSWERLSGLSRDEVNREFLHIEEHNRDLMFHFMKLQQENDTLKQLLKDNGIDPQKATATASS